MAPKYVVKYTLAGHSQPVSCVKFSPDGTMIATASVDAIINLYNLDGSYITMFLGHEKGVSDVSWSTDSKYLVSASDDLKLRIWDITVPTSLMILEGHTQSVFCCNFNPSSNVVASGSFDETVRLWYITLNGRDVSTGACLKILPAHSDPVTAVCFNRDGTLLVSSSYDGLIRIWDTNSGQCLKTLIDDSNPAVSFVKFSPNGLYILACCFDCTIRLWDFMSGKCVKTYSGYINTSYACPAAFIANPKLVVSGSTDGKIYIWDLQSKEIVSKIDAHGDALIGIATHPSLNLIASASIEKEGMIKIWGLDDGSMPSTGRTTPMELDSNGNSPPNIQV